MLCEHDAGSSTTQYRPDNGMDQGPSSAPLRLIT